MVGARINHYEILDRLGVGGMGEVWLARDTRLGRKIALKVLPHDLAADPERRERFEREARAVAALNHPNIVTIHSVEEGRPVGGDGAEAGAGPGEGGGPAPDAEATRGARARPEGLEDTGDEDGDTVHFFTMELVEGKPLSDVIPGDGLPQDTFYSLALQLVDALAAAHRKGITHRDLKPGNVMVTDDGRVKVLDFGLAKLTESVEPDEAQTMVATSGGSGDLTEAGQIIGTVSYMSPEQAEGRPVDQRSDIFSLGVLLYEMATGRQAFSGETKISVITSILRDSPPSITDLNARLPRRLGELLERSFAKEPADRYQSSEDLKADLEELKVAHDTSQLRASDMALGAGLKEARDAILQGRRPASGERSVPWGAVAGVAAVLVIGGLLAAWMWPGLRGGPPSPPLAPAGERDAVPSLAVLYFENLSGDQNLDWLRTGLTDMLVTDLSQSPHVRVLGTDRLYQILSEMGRLDDPMNSFELVQEVARQGNVDNVLLGGFARAGDTVRINARLQDAASGEILTSEQVQGAGEEAIFDLVDQLTRRIKSEFELPEQPAVADVDADLETVTTDSLQAYRHYAEGLRMVDAGRPRDAVPHLEQALEVDPDFAMAMAKLSVAHGNAGDEPSARAYAERAMDHAESLSDRERLYIEARYYSLRPETIQEAIETYRRLVERHPDHTAARNNLAVELMDLERWEEAIDHLEALRRMGTSFSGSYANLARAYSRVGRFEEGARILREFVDGNPDSPAAHADLAEHLARWGRYDEALAELDVADGLRPDTWEHAGLRWQIHALQGRWDSARRLAEGLRARDEPRARAEGIHMLAREHLARGRVAPALELAEQVLVDESYPADVRGDARNAVTGTLVDAGRAEEAVPHFEAIQEQAGDDLNDRVNAMFGLALVDAIEGRMEEARERVDRAWALVGEIDVPERILRREELAVRGQVEFAGGQWERAVEHLRGSAELLPRHPDAGNTGPLNVWYALGVALYETGELDDARSFLERVPGATARVYSPIDWVRSYWYLGEIARRQGRADEARGFFAEFVGRWGEGEIDRDRVASAREFLEGRGRSSPGPSGRAPNAVRGGVLGQGSPGRGAVISGSRRPSARLRVAA